MKLEIKHLSCYLPYGLKYHLPLDSERFDSIMEDEPFIMALPFMDETEKTKHFNKYQKMYLFQENPQIMWDDNKIFLGQMISSLGFEEDDVYLDEVKPILRPLSDLTKEIEVNGERFVPIEWLNKNKSVKLIKVINTQGDIEVFNGKTSNWRFFEYCVIEKLFEWHFDVFGLIEAGLAIDINTLNN